MDKYIFGFDVSSSVIGWSIFKNNSYFDSGFIKFKTNKQDLYDRANTFSQWLEGKLRELCCSSVQIVLEAPKLGFGKTTALTMSTLQRFNGFVSYAIYGLSGVRPELVSEGTARKQAGLVIKRKHPEKEKIQAGNQVMKFPWFPKEHILYKKPSKKHPNGDSIKDECYDETDAIILCLYAVKKTD